MHFVQSLSAVSLQTEDFGVFFFFFFPFKNVLVLTHDPMHVKEIPQHTTYLFSCFLFIKGKMSYIPLKHAAVRTLLQYTGKNCSVNAPLAVWPLCTALERQIPLLENTILMILYSVV